MDPADQYHSPYLYSNNNPVSFVDTDGNYALSIHYNLTAAALRKFGQSESQTDLIAHYASVFADHPAEAAIKWNNRVLDPNQSYRPGIDYSTTVNSQNETDPKYNTWHSMRTNTEAKSGAISRKGAMMRGMEFGWTKIFESAKYGTIASLKRNSKGIQALGQGLHALQDGYAHKGASWSEHSVMNDVYGSTDQAAQITESAVLVHNILNSDFSAFENSRVTLTLTGMSTKQKKAVLDALRNNGIFQAGGSKQ